MLSKNSLVLNKKGYMLVELVVASVLAMSIGYYLLKLTYSFKDTTTDIYQEITYLSDKTIITKNIMNDLDRGTITEITTFYISSDKKDVKIIFDFLPDGSSTTEQREIRIVTDTSGTTIYYGKISSTDTFSTSDVSYYKKTLQSSLVIDTDDIVAVSNDEYIYINIPVNSLYDSSNYDITIFAEKNV